MSKLPENILENLPVSAEPTAEELIAEHVKVGDFLKSEQKRFDEYTKPYKARMEEIEGKLLAMLNALGGGTKKNLSTDAGTAYLSNIMTPSVDVDAPDYKGAKGREALLDFALDHWDEYGSEMLMLRPQKDAVEQYMQEHNGQPPPGVKVSYFARLNIRRS